MAGPIDNPYGGLKAYPKVDPLEIDDPFEGKKLENLDEPEWEKKAKAKAKGTTKGRSMSAAAKKAAVTPVTRTPYGMTQKQLAELPQKHLAQVWRTAAEKGAMRIPPSVPSGVQSALKAAPRVLGAAARVAPPIAAGMLARDIYTGVQDPNFMTGLINMFGGEENAYNAWAAQEAEEGRERPSYEEYLAQAEAMEEGGGMPDTREVAKSALAPRHSQEMGPEDTE